MRGLTIFFTVACRFFHLLSLEIIFAIKSLFKVGNFHRIRLRRVFLVFPFFIISCWVLYWFLPGLYYGDELVKTNSLEVCMSDRLKAFQKKLSDRDAVLVPLRDISSNSDDVEVPVFPMIGNGHFGVSWHGTGHLLLHNRRSLNWPLEGVYPLLHLQMPAEFKTGNILVDFRDGMMHKFQCFKLSFLCLASTVTAYAHRTRPNLLVQHVKLYNPTNKDASMKLSFRGTSLQEKGFQVADVRVSTTTSDEHKPIEYVSATQRMPLPRDPLQRHVWVVLLIPKFPTLLAIPRDRTLSYHFITAVALSEPFSADTSLSSAEVLLNSTISQLRLELSEALALRPDELAQEHTDAWNSVWSSGFYISPSLAPGAVNGIDVNSTIFLLLSHTPDPKRYKRANATVLKEVQDALLRPDRCYNGHDTFHVSELWRRVRDEHEAQSLVNVWLLTLEKQGCSSMLKAGAEGVLQALVLSLGAFEYSGEHLEFGMDPSDLHREFHFRGIFLYHLHARVEIRVRLDDELRPGLTVLRMPESLASEDDKKPLYACGAVCAGGPVLITGQGTPFPVKLTRPRTALLYLSDSQEHLQELGHAVHVSDVRDAPAHDQNVIALHKHGHSWGGVPLVFWVAIILLVAVFHVFLCRLVYQEYWGKGEGTVASLPPASFRYQKHSNIAWHQQHSPNWMHPQHHHVVF